MLPLWIIDISANRDRRETFVSLLERIDHVHISQTYVAAGDKHGKANPAADHTPADQQAGFAAQADEQLSRNEMMQDDPSQSLSQQELLDQWERRSAEKNAIIKGDYWYYSAFGDVFSDVRSTNSEDLDAPGGVADQLYFFQSRLVEAGKNFIRILRQSNAKPYQAINVLVLGDSTEPFTQAVFASIAAMLQKEKERILPAHIHQGMCIYGALFVPCDINAREVGERNRVLRLLNEVEVQHHLRQVRGYDHVMLYQDVQNRTECTYTLMDHKLQAEYLLQCVIHLFYACDATHPLISGTRSADQMYFSMGATSLFFDMHAEDVNDASRLASELITNIKLDSEEEATDRDELHILDLAEFSAEKFIHDINEGLNVDIPDAEMEDPSPHPILHYMQKSLKRLYYFYYLRFYPAKMLRRITDNIERGTSDLLDKISIRSSKMYHNCEKAILPALARVISKVHPNDGVLAAIDRQLIKLQERMSFEKERISEELEHHYWDLLLEPEKQMIPDNQKDYFENYHEVYRQDNETHNGGTGQAEMKQQATDKLLDLLSSEQTTLATLGRVFLLGIVCVLALLPVLSLISPTFVDLGDVKGHTFWWAIALFMLPLLIQLVVLCFYVRKKNVCIRVLKAYYKHDAYARLANRIEFEACDYYNKMLALCDAYLERNKQIRKEVEFRVPELVVHMQLPETTFNQPLRSGRFNDEEILPANEVEGCRIRVNYRPELISELNKKHYFMLINHLNDEIAILYRDVRVIDEHTRRFNDQTQQYEFVSKDELLREKAEQWEKHKEEFRHQMINAICGEMLPRENPTVGEKLLQYERKTGNIHLLDTMIEYAAANGEIICDADPECSDIKINKDISYLLSALPSHPCMQNAEYNSLYQRYLFITRWRSFDSFSLNRILPTEDFDQSIRNIRVFDDEQKAKRKKEKEKAKRNAVEEVPVLDEAPQETPYSTDIPALILWAICPDDTSNEWLRLFNPSHFAEAYRDRQCIRKIMNKED